MTASGLVKESTHSEAKFTLSRLLVVITHNRRSMPKRKLMSDPHMLIWQCSTLRGVPAAPDALQMACWTVARLVFNDQFIEVAAVLVQRPGTRNSSVRDLNNCMCRAV